MKMRLMRGVLRASRVVSLLCGGVAAFACGSADTVSEAQPSDHCHEVVLNTDDEIPPSPNGVDLCPSGPCNYQDQSGCAADRNCAPAPTAAGSGITPACIPITIPRSGEGTTGDACRTSNECAKGYACGGGACRRLCCGLDRDACGAGETCFQELFMALEADGEQISTGAYLCYPTGCDVLTSEDCPAGFDCKIIDPAGTTACIPPSPEELGEPCEAPSICRRGLTCVGPDGQKTCRRLCRHEACGEPACQPGEGACVHFNRDPEGVGECTPGFE